MTRADFEDVLDRMAAGWRDGDAAAVAACFALDLSYADPLRYSFARRDDLLAFFEPPPGGHHVVWHRIVFDEAEQAGAVEYTYEGHHRYHGAALVGLGPDGLILDWREWQHVDDEHHWQAFLAGATR